MIKAAIIGGTGMTGRTALDTCKPPFCKINSITSRGSAGQNGGYVSGSKEYKSLC